MQINIKELTLTDIFKLSQFIKERCRGLLSLEEVAIELMSIFCQTFITDSGKSALVLSRFFKSCMYEELPDDIKIYIQHQECKNDVHAHNRYLIMMGTSGDVKEWNCRKESKGHQALPLYDPHIIDTIPMLSALLSQIGLDIPGVAMYDNKIIIEKTEREYGVFCVEEAKGSRLIPAQAEFVGPFGVESVIGFGGHYKTDQIYAVIMFCREKINRKTATLFASLNPTVQLLTLRHEMTGNIFTLKEAL